MGELVRINDNNWRRHVAPIINGERKLHGYRGMFRRPSWQYKSFEEAVQIPRIPRNEWDDRIRQQEKDGTDLKTFCMDNSLEVLDQNQTNFCWANGVIYCAMIQRLQSTFAEWRLSPASIAAPIKNFQNRGGWGDEAVEYMVQNGCNSIDEWPANAINRQYYTAANREKAKRNRVLDWFVVRTFDDVASCVLAGIPVAVGYNWWAHLVCGVGLEVGNHNLLIANSWSTSWGDQGFGVLEGSRKVPDGAIAIVTMLAA